MLGLMPSAGDMPGWATLIIALLGLGGGGYRSFMVLVAKVDNGFKLLEKQLVHNDEKHAEHKEHLKDLEGRVRVLERESKS